MEIETGDEGDKDMIEVDRWMDRSVSMGSSPSVINREVLLYLHPVLPTDRASKFSVKLLSPSRKGGKKNDSPTFSYIKMLLFTHFNPSHFHFLPVKVRRIS